MLAVTSSPGGKKLTEQQERFVTAYLTDPNVSKAAKIAGYAHINGGYAAMKTAAVQKAIADQRSRLIESEGATVAYNTLMDCMRPGNPGSVRVAAAKLVWQAAGILEKHGAAGDKPLQEMTADELRSVIDACDGAMAKVADQAKPIKPAVIDG